jgi:hypothetical protein
MNVARRFNSRSDDPGMMLTARPVRKLRQLHSINGHRTATARVPRCFGGLREMFAKLSRETERIAAAIFRLNRRGSAVHDPCIL